MQQVFEFADTYRGSYNDSIGNASCPFYCDYSGYMVYEKLINWDVKIGIFILFLISKKIGFIFRKQCVGAG